MVISHIYMFSIFFFAIIVYINNNKYLIIIFIDLFLIKAIYIIDSYIYDLTSDLSIEKKKR